MNGVLRYKAREKEEREVLKPFTITVNIHIFAFDKSEAIRKCKDMEFFADDIEILDVDNGVYWGG